MNQPNQSLPDRPPSVLVANVGVSLHIRMALPGQVSSTLELKENKMPVDINILENGEGIEFISSGTVTGKEIIEANKKIYTPEHLSKLKYKIIDRTTCTEYLVTNEEIKVIANQDIQASKINNNITIILVSPTPLQHGMTRVWQVLSEESGFKSEIFKDRESADEYINKILKKF